MIVVLPGGDDEPSRRTGTVGARPDPMQTAGSSRRAPSAPARPTSSRTPPPDDMPANAAATPRHSVSRNMVTLFGVTALNYLMPLILIPFLARALGVEQFGVYAFGMSIYLIGLLIIDYGFPVHGLYSVAEHRDDPERVGVLLGSMLAIKLGLFAVLAAALGMFVWFSDKYADHRLFLMLMMLPLLGAALQFRWVFQAVEQSGKIFQYTVVGRVLHVGLVIALVASPQDYLWVPIGHGAAMILAGLMCIVMMRRLGYGLRMPGWGDIVEQLRGASSYFWANVASAHLGFMGVFMLGLVVAPAALAVYSVAEQLYRAIRSVYYPIADALMPFMKRSNDTRMFRRISIVVLGGTAAGVALGIALAPWLIRLLFGEQYVGADRILQILLLALLVCVPSILIGYPLLGSNGYGSQVNRIVVLSAVASAPILGLMWYADALNGTSVAWMIVASESIIFLGLMTIMWRVRGKLTSAGLSEPTRKVES